MTKVKFYNELNGVLAVFPDMKETFNGYRHNNITCYSHVGQHSACNPDYLKGKRLAKPEQYADLLNELKGQGYDDLIVLNVPISKEDQRQLDIDAGKIWICYDSGDIDNILFEGSRSSCVKWAKTTFPVQYKYGTLRIAKLIWEKQTA